MVVEVVEQEQEYIALFQLETLKGAQILCNKFSTDYFSHDWD